MKKIIFLAIILIGSFGLAQGYPKMETMTLEPRASAPINPVDGQMYYDATQKSVFIWNGNQWLNSVTVDTNTDSQTLSLMGADNNQLRISGGNTISLSGLGGDIELYNDTDSDDPNKAATANVAKELQDQINDISASTSHVEVLSDRILTSEDLFKTLTYSGSGVLEVTIPQDLGDVGDFIRFKITGNGGVKPKGAYNVVYNNFESNIGLGNTIVIEKDGIDTWSAVNPGNLVFYEVSAPYPNQLNLNEELIANSALSFGVDDYDGISNVSFGGNILVSSQVSDSDYSVNHLNVKGVANGTAWAVLSVDCVVGEVYDYNIAYNVNGSESRLYISGVESTIGQSLTSSGWQLITGSFTANSEEVQVRLYSSINGANGDSTDWLVSVKQQ